VRRPPDVARVKLRTKQGIALAVLWITMAAGIALIPYFEKFASELSVRFGIAIIGAVVAMVVWRGLNVLAMRVQGLNRSALEISRGDLSRPVELDEHWALGRDEVDELSTAIHNMQQNLRELVAQIQRTARAVSDQASLVQGSAENVSGASEEVSSSMEQIAKGAEMQKQLVERASTIIREIAETISRTAQAGEDASKSARETSAAAQEGGAAARTAGDKLKKVFSQIEQVSETVFAFGEKTQEISKIVVAITGVAQQTNLLALNAAIEAARAGEAGRGFQVVAEEVRKLAEAAGRSAEQISRLAHEISLRSTSAVAAMKEGIEELGEGRRDVESILTSLDAISRAAIQNADQIQLISAKAREQLTRSEEMVRAIQNISSVAGSNASSTEEVARAIREQSQTAQQMTGSAQELTNLSLELHSVVTKFRLGG
jgi:methyl-accepting chemotaxis protein